MTFWQQWFGVVAAMTAFTMYLLDPSTFAAWPTPFKALIYVWLTVIVTSLPLIGLARGAMSLHAWTGCGLGRVRRKAPRKL